MFDVYVESGVGGHIDNATQAWMFDLDHWGTCGQGDDEAAALADLARRALVASARHLEPAEAAVEEELRQPVGMRHAARPRAD